MLRPRRSDPDHALRMIAARPYADAMHRLWIGLGGIAGGTAVALAAWAAHAAPAALDPPQLATLQAGLAVQGWHAPALLAIGVWSERRGGLAHVAAAALAVGLALFLAGLYAAALARLSLGPVAPIGGLVLIAGWALVALAALRRG